MGVKVGRARGEGGYVEPVGHTNLLEPPPPRLSHFLGSGDYLRGAPLLLYPKTEKSTPRMTRNAEASSKLVYGGGTTTCGAGLHAVKPLDAAAGSGAAESKHACH